MYEELFSNIDCGIIIHNRSGDILDMNNAARSILGVNEKYYAHLDLLVNDLNPESLDGSGIPGYEFPSISVLETGEKLSNVKLSVTKPGNKIKLLLNITVFPDSKNEKFYTTFTDITEQTDLIISLERSRQNLETAENLIHLGFWELNIDSESVYWSEELYKIFSRDLNMGPPNYSEFIFYIHPEDRYNVDELFQNALVTGASNNVDFRTNPDLGPLRYINTQYYCEIRGDKVVKVHGINTDISQRIKTEQHKLQTVEILYKAINIAGIGYWEYDVIKDMFTFNDTFYKLFGTNAERAGGYKMSSSRYAELFVHPEDIMIVGNEIRKAIEIKEPNFHRRIKHRIIREDGEIRIIEVHFFIVKGEDGRTIGTYGVNQDITESLKQLK